MFAYVRRFALTQHKLSMYDFLLQTIFFASIGLVIYLLARAVPRVDEAGEVIHAPGRFDRFLSRLPLHEIDARINIFFEKFLRRLKVMTMKSDNLINKYLGKIKKHNKSALPEIPKNIFDKETKEQ